MTNLSCFQIVILSLYTLVKVNMSNLENNCKAMVVKKNNPIIRYGEVVTCIETMPTDSVINNGRLGRQVADKDGMWWVMNNHGSWLEHEKHLVRLYDDGSNSEHTKTKDKPPTHGATMCLV